MNKTGLFRGVPPEKQTENFKYGKSFQDSQYKIMRDYALSPFRIFDKANKGIVGDPYRFVTHTGELYDLIRALPFIKKNPDGGIVDKSITWQMLPEIVDLIANNTESDEEFRLQLWALFGVHMYAPMNKLLDDTNRGLSLELHNSA
ncbi:MAG: hypothetical protein R2857_14445 [Vampirovibrionales bacterium]